MTPAQARELARDLVARATSGEEAAWDDGARTMAGLDGRDWLALDQASRRYGITGMPAASGTRGWLGPSVNEPTGFVSAMTSMHVDGRFRERAVDVLAAIDGDLTSRALAVRLLDHVPEVREHAMTALLARLDSGTVDLALDVVLAGKDRFHAGEAIARFRECVDVGDLMSSQRRRVRRWAFRQMHERGSLDAEALVAHAVHDDDQWIEATCAGWLMQADVPAELAPLLHARSAEARLVAITRAPPEALTRDVFERLLVDRAPRVREQARWRARRIGFDDVATYRTMLRSEFARERAAAVDALGETNVAADDEAVRGALDDSAPRVRAAAVAAFAARARRDEAVTTLAPMLVDVSGRVAGAAARALAVLGVPGAIAEGAWQSDRVSSRRAAWRVARSAGGWDRVEADLRASTDDDPGLRGLGEAGVHNWLAVGAATTYATLGDEQRGRIRTLLDASSVHAEAKRILAFHGGLTSITSRLSRA